MPIPKNLICYTTGRKKTTKLVQQFARGLTNHPTVEWIPRVVNIQDFLDHGHPKDADAVASLGILRGTGLALQAAAAAGIDRYYIDHSYFNPGYGGIGWMRITKNKHSMNAVPKGEVFVDRWQGNFAKTNTMHTWKARAERGDKILVLPPTHAIQWYFNAYTWEDIILTELKKALPPELHSLIKVRKKPNEPIVDKLGNLVRLETTVSEDSVSLEEDLLDTNVVVAYNSSVALRATLMGLPVITNQHNCCYPISYTISDLAQGTDNPKFDVEPDRIKLVSWLSNCQFSSSEIQRGTSWQMLKEVDNALDI